ncbi:hypothetical protein AB0D97_32230 [Streptomyces roseus]|uniref:hypothetical protein n=1 Tax=Streptomyces roseus TaxID=66430 RepID=UPI0033FE369C
MRKGRARTRPPADHRHPASDLAPGPVPAVRTWTIENKVSGNWVPGGSKVNHFDCSSDKPRWIVADTTTGALTRNVDSLSGDLGATTSATGDVVLHLATIHGDVTLQLVIYPLTGRPRGTG